MLLDARALPRALTCATSCERSWLPRAHSGTGFLGWSSSLSWSLLQRRRRRRWVGGQGGEACSGQLCGRRAALL